MNIDPHDYSETFIAEDSVKSAARARGVENGVTDVSQGAGAYLRQLAHQIKAQSVVEVGTGSGVGSLWLLEGMLSSGTLTSIDDEMEHTSIAKIALADAEIALELILDGVHLNDSETLTILKSAPGRVIAITDAMSAAGCIDGDYAIGKLEVRVDKGIARLKSNNALAGSTLTMDRAFLNLINNFGFSVVEASYATSTLPARRIGLGNVGSIEVGKRADFIEFTHSGLVKNVNN